MTEQLLEGFKEIARLLNCSTRTIRRRKKELIKAKIIFKKYVYRNNRPPPRSVWCCYPSKIKEYFANKGSL